MSILSITKIEGGLSWNGMDRQFTFNHGIENGFEVISSTEILIELDGNMICFNSTEVTIDSEGPFVDVSELLTAIYGISDQWLQFKI